LPKKAQKGFCNTTAKNGDICSEDRKGIAYCGLAEYADDLPKEFQYFDDGKVGGVDRLLDSDSPSFIAAETPGFEMAD